MTLSRRRFLRNSSGLLLAAGSPAFLRAAVPSPAPIRMDLGAPGLDFILENSAAGRMYQVETVLGGLGVIDYDNDGWPDLFCTNGAALPSLEKTTPAHWNRLYRNNRDGSFTDVTEKAGLQGAGYSMGVAVADFDNNGHQDLFVAGVHGNHLYRNNGNGTFTDVTLKAGLSGPGSLGRPAWTVAACWFDYDSDGHLDLFLSNYCDWSPGTDPLCGGLADGSRAYCHPDRYRAQQMQLFHNNGDGTFTEVTRKDGLPELLGKGMGIALSVDPFANHPSLFIANDNARNLLLHIQGKSFSETGIEAGVAYNGDGRNISGMGADFGDIDGDGLPDIVMTGLKNETWEVFLNRGKGLFDDGSVSTGLLNLSRQASGWGCGLVDLDNDGWLDLFVAGGGLEPKEAQPNRIFRNLGGRFADVSATAGPDFARPALHRGVVFADFDRDGRIDAAVTAIHGRTELWWNRTPTPNHWLQLSLTGTASNRSAIGALVTCRTPSSPRPQIRTVNSSVGYASSSDLTLHFGLGPDSSAQIDIRWPSGRLQSLGTVPANQRISLVEPPQ